MEHLCDLKQNDLTSLTAFNLIKYGAFQENSDTVMSSHMQDQGPTALPCFTVVFTVLHAEKCSNIA